MQLMKWTPFREMMNIPSHFDSLFDDFFYPSRRLGREAGEWNWNPVVDVYEDEHNIVLKAELPGVDKEQVTVDVEDGTLTLKGEKAAENQVEEDKYHRRERFYGRFQRSFRLPADVDLDKIKAQFKDGVLRIEVPKPESQKPKQITVH